jgi:hypothetical protein
MCITYLIYRHRLAKLAEAQAQANFANKPEAATAPVPAPDPAAASDEKAAEQIQVANDAATFNNN